MKKEYLKKIVIGLSIITTIQVGATAHASKKNTYKEVVISEELYPEGTNYNPTAEQLEKYIRRENSENDNLNVIYDYDYIIDSNLNVIKLEENSDDDKLVIFILSGNDKNAMDNILEIITPIIEEEISDLDTYCIRKTIQKGCENELHIREMSVLKDEEYWSNFLEQFKDESKGQTIKINNQLAGIVVSDKTFKSNDVELVSFNNKPSVISKMVTSLKNIFKI